MKIKNMVMLLFYLLTIVNLYAQQREYKLLEIKNSDELFTKEFIKKQMRQTLDWQLQNMPEESWLASANKYEKIEGNGWIRSAFYTGVMAAYETTKEKKYLDNIYEWGIANNWEPAKRPRHADDHCCIQTYADVFFIDGDSSKLQPAIKTFNEIAADPKLGSEVGWQKDINWNWCDALFMAPPAMTRLAAATGEIKYLKTMDLMFWDTYEYLFDKNENLFYRDDRFKPNAEPLLLSANGKPIFWSRGNGWVLAGLARVLRFMPDDFVNKLSMKNYLKICPLN